MVKAILNYFAEIADCWDDEEYGLVFLFILIPPLTAIFIAAVVFLLFQWLAHAFISFLITLGVIVVCIGIVAGIIKLGRMSQRRLKTLEERND